MISFIVPAHNEEALVGQCVSAIKEAMKAVARPFEIIVVDDSSTDATGSVAEKHGARTIQVNHRHISATRNAGGRVAKGRILFFVDADTIIDARIVQEALHIVGGGKSGGGCIPQFDGDLPLWFRIVYPVFKLLVRIFKQPGGSCLFCTREAFDAVGGFSEAHFAAEDAVFITELKKLNGFAVLPGVVITSGRKFRSYSPWHFLILVLRLSLKGPDAFRNKKGLEMWYGALEK